MGRPKETTTLYLRGVERRVVREAKAAAARRGTTLARFVNDTLDGSLRGEGMGELIDEGDRLDDEMEWFEENRRSLARRFPGEYVAVIGRAIQDHDADFEGLARRVFDKRGARPTYMPLVEEEQPVRHLRSPRRVP